MKLPKSFTTVTTFSKTLAFILFITLPFLGFYLGMEYQKFISPHTSVHFTKILKKTSLDVVPTKTQTLPSKNICTMEARVCPDGSSVGRTGPNCAFAPCP